MAGRFVHLELNTDAPAAAGDFYARLFGWRVDEVSVGSGEPYRTVHAAGLGAGIQRKAVAKSPAAWLPYVEVQDLAKCLASVSRLGGRVSVPRTEVAGQGALAVVEDPSGALVGLWEAGGTASASGSKSRAEVGAPRAASAMTGAKPEGSVTPAAKRRPPLPPKKEVEPKKQQRTAHGRAAVGPKKPAVKAEKPVAGAKKPAIVPSAKRGKGTKPRSA